METRAVQRQRAKTVILSMACIALALSITDNASGSPQTGVLPATLSATSLSFGNVGEKSPSTSKNITLYNNEAVALNISITLSNPDYTETDTCKGSVAAKGNCTISVTLTPSALGADNGTLSVTDTASNSPQTAALTGTGVLPATLSPTSLSFGNVPQSTASTSKNITLYNYEAVALKISITLSNPDYSETDTCKGSVPARYYCIMTVTLTPSVLGADNGTLSVTDTASNSPQTAALTGTGVLPATLSATSLSFGNWGENSPSTSKNITLYNNEAVALSFSITLSNPDYTESDTCKGSVAAKGYCTMTVTLTPSVLGADNGTLSVTDTASNSPQTAALTGTGVLPATLSPTSLSFGNVPQSTASTSKNITLYNYEAVALKISITLSNPDYTETDTCKGSVAARYYCVVTVTLTPSVLGADNGTLSVTDTASNSPQTAALAGTGVLPATLSATFLNFGNVPQNTASTSKNITLYNNEAVALKISITLSNPDYTESDTCKGSVAAKGYCTMTVTLKPSALGADNGTLSVTDTASNSPQTAALNGTGTGPVDALAPTSLAFGNQSVRAPSTAQTATLSNTGNAALNITSIALAGTNASDFAQTNTCGSSVAAGAKCTISVTFTPSASGNRTASVSITDNASGSPQTVSLSGAGTNPQPSLTSLSPASAAAGAAAETLTINGTNFVSSSTVTYNGGAHTPALVSSTQLTISLSTSDQATAGTYAVVVTNPTPGGGASNSVSFTVASPIVSLSPTSLAFGNQPVDMTSSAQSVTLSNTGNAALSIASFALTGTNASDFSQSNTCGSSLAAGANCTIVVMFTPSVTGTRAASLSIADNASGSPQTVPLSGAGTHDVILSWTASTTTGVVGYNVYRGTASGGEGTAPLNSSPVGAGCTSTTTCTYTDAMVVAGTTYYYTVTAVASNDVTQSANSNQVSATVPSP